MPALQAVQTVGESHSVHAGGHVAQAEAVAVLVSLLTAYWPTGQPNRQAPLTSCAPVAHAKHVPVASHSVQLLGHERHAFEAPW
jgi:hypothetical protein